MRERKQPIRELWDQFCACDPKSTDPLGKDSLLFYAGAVAMYLWLARTQPRDEAIEDLIREVRDYYNSLEAAALVGTAYHA